MKSALAIVTTGVLLAAGFNAAAQEPAPNPGQDQNQDRRPDGRGDRSADLPPRAGATGTATTGNGISYHGGPLILGTTKIYYIWYGNWNSGVGPAAVAILTTLAQSIGGSPYFNINTTYSDGANRSVSNSVAYGGSAIDNYSRGTALTDGDIGGIVTDAINAGRLPLDANAVYFVLTSPDVNATSGFCTQYCGWHTAASVNGAIVKYAFIGDADRCPSSCAPQSTGPNGTTGADAMASIIAHELEEAVTDPQLNAWYDSAGNENADKCAWRFGTTYAAANGASANMNLGGRDYLIQQNWVNASGGYCALSYSATPDFNLSASPPTQQIAPGGTATYTVTIAPTNGFTASVSLSVSGLPSGASASFNANPATTSSTLTVTTTGSIAAGSYPLTITGTSGALTHTAGATLTVALPPDFTISAAPATRSIAAGALTTYTVTIAAVNGFTGSVSFGVTGLPPGVASGFSPASVSTSGSSTLTLTTSSGTPPGTYPLTITGTSGSTSHSAGVSLTVTVPVAGGTLTASTSTPVGPVQLTTAGSLDWAHWGLTTASSFDHKAAVAQQIGNFTVVGSGTPARYINNAVGFTWTDGTPTATATNSTTGVFITGLNNGFQITAPADTTSRTLSVYVGAWHTQSHMVAQLSDGSAPAYTDSSLSNTVSPTTLLVYTFNYQAASAGQTLTVTFTNIGAAGGNVTLQAAALAGTAPAPDFTLTAAPASQPVTAGNNIAFTATVAGQNGFSGTVGLAAGGMPSGMTASFSPTSITGSGSSTVTIAAAGTTAPGTYNVTVTGTSGSLVHTTNVSVTVTAAATGALTGSMAAPAGPVQLTIEGAADWTHWGLNTAADFDHKANVTPAISNITVVGTGTVSRYINNSVGFTWTDGTPVAAATNSTTGVFITGQNNGFRITAPADAILRTLRVYVGAWHTQSRLTAHLSDGSAADYVDTSLVNTVSPTSLGVYTLTYHAASAGQTLTVTFTNTTATGNVTIQASTLAP